MTLPCARFDQEKAYDLPSSLVHHRYSPEPNSDTYLALLDLVETTRAAIATLEPRDNMDIQSFIWVVGEYREGDERER